MIAQNKVWFITGVSSGLGRHLAEEVAKSGNIVIGTVRKQEQLAGINDLLKGKTFGYLLDVNDHQQVNETIHAVVNEFGQIDVLVNNAGYGLMGAIEETSMEEARAQMETNFFGALAVTQAVLPVMRKQGSGHIVQISSQAGISANHGLGIYNASKFALEGFSEALYKEVLPLGIKVTLVEPGPFRTEWAGASMKFAEKTIEAYADTAGRLKQYIQSISGNQPGDPIAGAHSIMKIVAAENPPLRLALGKLAVETLRKKADWIKQEVADWEKVSADADYKN
ncbi:SDR family NAD(P)-dependent oxidoreductase [Ferruginibacter lapsinanis]|uniref:oxidoreductase n=1 Tax=Ferruginibacter lapsinanis TaxID=563172 RepID=UPI001E287A93|nr:oxidoreductase [Ferruginibacter lapsinanis]UEG50935.1 SDR family NAD(P)-dependent oxidoreductase [Ferruginibacter lapsinanis]